MARLSLLHLLTLASSIHASPILHQNPCRVANYTNVSGASTVVGTKGHTSVTFAYGISERSTPGTFLSAETTDALNSQLSGSQTPTTKWASTATSLNSDAAAADGTTQVSMDSESNGSTPGGSFSSATSVLEGTGIRSSGWVTETTTPSADETETKWVATTPSVNSSEASTGTPSGAEIQTESINSGDETVISTSNTDETPTSKLGSNSAQTTTSINNTDESGDNNSVQTTTSISKTDETTSNLGSDSGQTATGIDNPDETGISASNPDDTTAGNSGSNPGETNSGSASITTAFSSTATGGTDDNNSGQTTTGIDNPGETDISASNPDGTTAGTSGSSPEETNSGSASITGAVSSTATGDSDVFLIYVPPTGTITGAEATAAAFDLAPLLLAIAANQAMMQNAAQMQAYIDAVKEANADILVLWNSFDDQPSSPDACSDSVLKRRSLLSDVLDDLDTAAELIGCSKYVMANLLIAVQESSPSATAIATYAAMIEDIATKLEEEESSSTSTASTTTETATSTTSEELICDAECTACVSDYVAKKRKRDAFTTATALPLHQRSLEYVDNEDWEGQEDDYFMEQVNDFEGIEVMNWNYIAFDAASDQGQWDDTPSRNLLAGLFGCTAISIVSEKGYWLAHFMEPGFRSESDAQISRWTDRIIGAFDSTSSFSAKLTNPNTLTGSDGYLNAASNPQIYVSTPRTSESTSSNPTLMYQDKVDELLALLTGDDAQFSGVSVTTQTYDVMNPFTEEGGSRHASSPRGKVLIEYDNNQLNEDGSAPATQQSMYRIWAETIAWSHIWAESMTATTSTVISTSISTEVTTTEAVSTTAVSTTSVTSTTEAAATNTAWEYTDECADPSILNHTSFTLAQAQEAITDFCSHTIDLGTAYDYVSKMYKTDGVTLMLSTRWDNTDWDGKCTVADKSLASTVAQSDCETQFLAAVNDCNTDTVLSKYGVSLRVWNSGIGCIDFFINGLPADYECSNQVTVQCREGGTHLD
ncbi:hypothetical protein G7Z17_g2935 [Cylindrodendrum hubeiense]|uniref:Uncharacterized protein n=1 Tax=Cylindrodendrum hubeiense TaxID=595255 RepID=A0A9P5HIV1_9HYPO|nr:hypothetical protein G7Z17_g2935 [Cylindrodendrum hubeiense]